ncbi:MAG: Gfo/Idh/MocA family oxidoreductase [Planctomycetota bacterium]|jgi:hypothetical protein
MKKVKFAFIGCGKIAPFYADVIKYLGHSIDVVVARKDSLNIEKFAERYKVRKKLYSVGSFLEYCDKSKNVIDCILVCTPWDITEQVLEELLTLDIPIMKEKPAVLSIDGLNKLKKKDNIDNLFVAYNRRYYDFIPTLRRLLESESPLCIDILCAEPIKETLKYPEEKIRRYLVYERASHMVDLLFYLFSDNISMKNIFEISSGNWISEFFVGEKTPLYIKILKDCPQNLYLRIFFNRKVVEISPYEKMTIYNKLVRQKIEGRRIYSPSIDKQIEVDYRFKPGFLNQMRYFIDKFVYKKNSSREYIKQLEKVTYFCDSFIKSKPSYKKREL